MSYWQDNLLEGETALHVTPVHWGVNMPAILLLGCAVAAFHVSFHLSVACVAGAALGGAWAWVRKVSTELVVTDQRIVAKTGIVSRHVVEISLEHLESVETDQSVMGRILNFGYIRIVGTGGTPACVSFMENPLAFRRAALEAKQRALQELKAAALN